MTVRCYDCGKPCAEPERSDPEGIMLPGFAVEDVLPSYYMSLPKEPSTEKLPVRCSICRIRAAHVKRSHR